MSFSCRCTSRSCKHCQINQPVAASFWWKQNHHIAPCFNSKLLKRKTLNFPTVRSYHSQVLGLHMHTRALFLLYLADRDSSIICPGRGQKGDLPSVHVLQLLLYLIILYRLFLSLTSADMYLFLALFFTKKTSPFQTSSASFSLPLIIFPHYTSRLSAYSSSLRPLLTPHIPSLPSLPVFS